MAYRKSMKSDEKCHEDYPSPALVKNSVLVLSCYFARWAAEDDGRGEEIIFRLLQET